MKFVKASAVGALGTLTMALAASTPASAGTAPGGVRVTSVAKDDCAFAVYNNDGQHCFGENGPHDIYIDQVSLVCSNRGWADYAWSPNPGEPHKAGHVTAGSCDDFRPVPGNTVVDWFDLHA
ncbi:hypothetical protein [Amycolatopsis samaneae]|uniref:Secreted protein n=1 Tax=Amycolatopsis samaneae TaxID=664691 RepID=A0ABW5G7E9_9PSEU